MFDDQTLTLLDFYPSKGTFLPNRPIELVVSGESSRHLNLRFEFIIHSGVELEGSISESVILEAGHFQRSFFWNPLISIPKAYGAELRIFSEDNDKKSALYLLETAFDSLESWTDSPRYGFLTDFYEDREDCAKTILALTKLHINGLQFYDWQFRHDELVPPTDLYVDPLGRKLALTKVLELIEQAQASGITAMPYLAIYGASYDFWHRHKEWGLYDENQKPILFGEQFLGIMNPENGGKWQNHLLEQCSRLLENIPFDGLHIDQYGDPKAGWNIDGMEINIPATFADFIDKVHLAHPEKAILFNAVGNWPIEVLARSPVSFNYIEVWPPDVAYTDLIRIVRDAQKLSGGKPVVVALYLHSNQPANILLAEAVILAAGGTRIKFGESAKLLADPYFPKYEEIPKKLFLSLRRYADFSVRYEDWMKSNELFECTQISGLPAGVLPFVRKVKQGWSICLVNLADPNAYCWNVTHSPPSPVEGFSFGFALPGEIADIWMVDPDSSSICPQRVDLSMNQNKVIVKVEKLKNMLVFFIQTK